MMLIRFPVTLRRNPADTENPPLRWQVFDADGELVCSIAAPEAVVSLLIDVANHGAPK